MRIQDTEIKVIKGDITGLEVGGIVNPANTELRMETGLAGIIREKGGGAVEEEALSKGPIDLGGVVVTKAGKLKAKCIIHAATMKAGGRADQTSIRAAAANALKCSGEMDLHSIAFPGLGCGAGDFPYAGAAKIIVQEIFKYLRDPGISLREIIVCLYEDGMFEVFDKTIRGYVEHIQKTLGRGPYVTVDVIIECQEGIILIDRSNPPYGWALPGGFVDYGESLEVAASREAEEETNLELVDLRQFHTYSMPGRDPRFHTISTVFVAEGKGTPKFGDDAKGLKIVRYGDLLELDYAFDHKDIVKEYLVEKDLD